jgi:hypothetical protein
VDALKRLKPDLNIRVLSPYERADDALDLTAAAKQGDYLYTLQAMPERYVQKEYRDRAVRAMIAKRQDFQCAW